MCAGPDRPSPATPRPVQRTRPCRPVPADRRTRAAERWQGAIAPRSRTSMVRSQPLRMRSNMSAPSDRSLSARSYAVPHDSRAPAGAEGHPLSSRLIDLVVGDSDIFGVSCVISVHRSCGRRPEQAALTGERQAPRRRRQSDRSRYSTASSNHQPQLDTATRQDCHWAYDPVVEAHPARASPGGSHRRAAALDNLSIGHVWWRFVAGWGGRHDLGALKDVQVVTARRCVGPPRRRIRR